MESVTPEELAALGYLVLMLAPGQIFKLVALPNAHTDRIAPGWIAVHDSTSGFSEGECAAVALDRGGMCVDIVSPGS